MLETKVESSTPLKGHAYRQWFISILANFSLITYGLQTGWISPMTKIFKSNQSPTGHALSDMDLSWVASIFCLSAVVGVPLFTYVTDAYGRKLGIILIAVLQEFSWLMKFSSANIAVLITARVLAGLAAGGCFNLIPIYVKEISRDDIRGLTGSLMMMSMNTGILAMYVIGAYLDYFTVLWIVIWVPFATILLLLKAPESPSYLVKIGKDEEAKLVIAWLNGLNEEDKIVKKELENLCHEKNLTESMPNISYIGLFKERSWRTGILYMAFTMTLNCWNGVIAILTYAPAIFEKSGISVNAELQSLSFPTLMIVGGFISMACVERFGRKPLVAITNFIISAATFGLGLVIYLNSQDKSVPGWLPAFLMVSAVASYSTGAGPVPYIMMSEMFNFQIRAKVFGLIISWGWFINFLQLLGYAPLVALLGADTLFCIYGVINFIAFLVGLLLLPETKGKSVEELESKFRRNN